MECCNRLFCCSRTCDYIGMVSVTSVSRNVTSASSYQSRPSMYIRGLISYNWWRLFWLHWNCLLLLSTIKLQWSTYPNCCYPFYEWLDLHVHTTLFVALIALHENLHKMWMKTCFHSHFMQIFMHMLYSEIAGALYQYHKMRWWHY